MAGQRGEGIIGKRFKREEFPRIRQRGRRSLIWIFIMNNEIKQAVILAGGRGERLRPFTDHLPKPMIPVNGRPFIEYELDVLKKNGIEEIVFLVGYLHQKFIEHFGDGRRFGLDIKYHVGAVEDDTGTRVRNAKSLFAPEFLLLYGDVYWPFLELKKMSEFFHSTGKMALMVAYDNKDGRGEQGFKCNVMIDESNKVLRYFKNTEGSPIDPECKWTETGFLILSRKVVDWMPKKENFSLNQITLPDLVKRNELVAWKTDQVQETITSPKHLSDFADKMKSLKAS